jgi:hypothetical protein
VRDLTVRQKTCVLPGSSYLRGMSNKEVVSNLLSRLPDDVSLQQIAREIEFIAGVREGLEQLDRGEGVGIAEVERLISSWTTR